MFRVSAKHAINNVVVNADTTTSIKKLLIYMCNEKEGAMMGNK